MGRIYEALQRSMGAKLPAEVPIPELGGNSGTLASVEPDVNDLDRVHALTLTVSPEQRLVTLGAERSLGAEKIRILAARMAHVQEQRKIKKVLITSTIKEEGKTVLASNLAISLARMSQRVLLIDGDCHQGTAGQRFCANGSPGLTNWWRYNQRIHEYLRRVNGIRLWLLPVGSPIEQPLELLQSDRLSDLMSEMMNWFDWIIIDSPPLAPLADAAVWAKIADGILLVTREGRTPKGLLKKVVGSLEPGKILGFILNDCSDPDQQYYSHYYKAHVAH